MAVEPSFFATALRCDDLLDHPDCCDSCHEDYDMGYPMIELYKDQDGVDAIVCCRVVDKVRARYDG